MSFLKSFLASMVIMAVIDFLWLGFVVSGFYMRQLAGIARIEGGKFAPIYSSAGVVYVVMALALVLFAMPKVAEHDPWYVAAGWAALLGFCIYATYDFTNHATLLNWPVPFMVADIFWGAAQFAITASVLQLGRRYLN
jgi:uncharacterized membrane protein